MKYFLFFLLISSQSFAQELNSAWSPPLGSEVDGFITSEGWEKPRLLPEPVNLSTEGGWTDSLALSKDGKTLVFSYSRYDFSTFMSSGGTKFVQTGPARTAETTIDFFRMFTAVVENGKWVVRNLPIPVSEQDHIAAPALSSDSLNLFYVLYRMNPYRPEIHLSSYTNNSWRAGKLMPPPINPSEACESDNPTLAGSLASAGILFIETKRKDPEAKKCGEKPELYRINVNNGSFATPIRLANVNGNGEQDKDTQPHVMPDGSQLYWTGIRNDQGIYGIFAADYSNDDYVNVRPVIKIASFTPPFTGKPVLIGEPNVSKLDKGLVMYFACGFSLDETSDKKNLKICFSRKPN